MKPFPTRAWLPRLGAAFATTIATGIVVSQSHAQCQYDVTVLQFPIDCGIGTVITAGLSLNENGAVVGRYKCPISKYSQGFLWTAEGGFVGLEPPPVVIEVVPTDINGQGVICGTIIVSGLGYRGFVYDHGVWTVLPPVVDIAGPRSSAAAINNSNVVVGQRSLAEQYVPYSAYIWSVDTGFIDLGDEYGLYSSAADVNEAGQAAISIGPLLEDEAFIWDGESLTPIGVIPGGFASRPAGINTYAHVACVGSIKDSNDKKPGDILARSFLWEHGETTLLGVLPGYAHTAARDISDLGIAVGGCTSGDNPNDRRGFLWQAAVMYDMNEVIPPRSGVFITRGSGISNKGQIIANGTAPGYGLVVLLLTPIDPSPADLDGDCDTDVSDLLMLLDEWGQTNSPADFDADGVVGILDLLFLLANWG